MKINKYIIPVYKNDKKRWYRIKNLRKKEKTS